jgi:hypothetical protein
MNYSIEIIEAAIREEKLFELFVGRYVNTFAPYGSLPVNDEFVFYSWISYFEYKKEDIQLLNLFEEILYKISIDEDFSWFSIYYVYWLLFNKKTTEYLQDKIQIIIDTVINNVISNKEKLKSDFRWSGNKKYNFSLWDDFKRMVNNLSEEYPYNFHVEKITEL